MEWLEEKREVKISNVLTDLEILMCMFETQILLRGHLSEA